jgi:hypothetical protein
VTTGDGIAVLDQGLCFGGGDLQYYGTNSNKSANGFMKCTYRKVEVTEKSSPSKQGGSSPEKKSPQKCAKNDEDYGDSSSELAEDSERDEDKKEEVSTRVEFQALHPFKDLYKCTPLYTFMQEFGQNIAPLSVVGTFLNYVGNHFLYYIKAVMKKKVFYANHQV